MLVVCGEALVDLISDGSPAGYVARPGGSPFNVAVGTARLEVATSLLTRFGGGRFGDVLRAHATASGVDVSLSINATQPPTLAVVSLNAGAAEYDFYVDGTADSGWRASELPDPLPAETLALHVGSIASWRAPATDAIIELVTREYERGAVLISFDPNLRPALVEHDGSTRARVEQLATLSHLIKVSAQDLAWLYPGDPPATAAGHWSQTGPEMVVLTDGPKEVRAFRGGRSVASLPAPAVSVVDTVGAGDAFTAGLLAALNERNRLTRNEIRDLDNETLAAVLASAGMVAALTCGRSGADPPTRSERDTAMRSISSA